MTSVDSAAAKFFRRYEPISRRPFDPSAAVADPIVRQVFETWHGAETDVLSAESLRQTLTFAETEFYHRTREIAETAATFHNIPEFSFDFMHLANHRAIAGMVGAKPVILFDADWMSLWFHFIANRLFADLAADTAKERTELDRNALDLLDELADGRPPSDQIRQHLAPWYARHRQLAAIADSMSHVMAYFVIAHEIGHIALGHLRRSDTYTCELEADDFAAKTFLAIRGRSNLHWCNIPGGYLSAPLLLFHLIAMIDFTRQLRSGKTIDLGGYPPPYTRSRALGRYLKHADAQDRGLHKDLHHSVKRLDALIASKRA